jgi:hypothetical protein
MRLGIFFGSQSFFSFSCAERIIFRARFILWSFCSQFCRVFVGFVYLRIGQLNDPVVFPIAGWIFAVLDWVLQPLRCC